MKVHGTAVVFEGKGLLIKGPSGSGKSDLALRLIDQGGTLISDDQVIIEDGIARAPEAIGGKLEVRGIGIIEVPHVHHTIDVTIELAKDYERFPEDKSILKLNPFEGSAIPKIKTFLKA